MSKWIVITSLLLPLSSESRVDTGQFYGLHQLTTKLKARLFHKNDQFHLLDYVDGDRGMAQLMGGFQRVEGVRDFVNGQPSGVNLFLYQVVMKRFSEDLAASCSTGVFPTQKARLNREFYSEFKLLCSKSQLKGVTSSEWLNLWNRILNYRSSAQEFELWRKFVLKEWGQRSPKDALAPVLKSLLLNPEFLLQH